MGFGSVSLQKRLAWGVLAAAGPGPRAWARRHEAAAERGHRDAAAAAASG